MSKKFAPRAFSLFLCVFVLSAFPTAALERIEIMWFLGLSTTGTYEQIQSQRAAVEAFNASQDRIRLDVIYANSQAPSAMLTQLIGAGASPDIVGPISESVEHMLQGQFLDLQPLIDQAGFDLSDYDPRVLDFYRREKGGLFGIPIIVYPSFLYFNRDLFIEDIPYPPETWGAPYADGREWTIETLSDVAQQLTLDANGNNPTHPDYDPDQVVQWGWQAQWNDLRGQMTLFGAGSLIDENGAAVIPNHWREALHWYYNGMWRDRFIPTSTQLENFLYTNPFLANRAAMAYGHSWLLTPNLMRELNNWGIAALPSYNGQITAKLHNDSFRILAMSKHPAEAFEAITYLLGAGVEPLIEAYGGGMPARLSLQPAYFARMDQLYPFDVNWQVMVDALNYIDVPHHERYLPNQQVALDRLSQFQWLYESTPDLALDAEIDTLRADLDMIFNAEE